MNVDERCDLEAGVVEMQQAGMLFGEDESTNVGPIGLGLEYLSKQTLVMHRI